MTNYPERRNDPTRSSLGWLAGIAGVGLGAAMAWRGVPAFRAGVSGVAAYFDDAMRAASVARGNVLNSIRGTSVMAKGALIEGGLFGQLNQIPDILRSPQMIADTKAILAARYGQQAAGFAQGNLRTMTVQDVLGNLTPFNPQYWRLGPNRFIAGTDVLNLRRAVTAGVVDPTHVIDRNLLVQTINANTQIIRDARMADIKTTASSLLSWMGNYSYLGASPVDFFMRELWQNKSIIGKISPHIPVDIVGRGLTAPGGDYGIQVGSKIYSVSGGQAPTLIGETRAQLYTSRTLVHQRAGQVGLGGKNLLPGGVTEPPTLADRKTLMPEYYQGVFGKLRGFFERSHGVNLPGLGQFGVGEGMPLGPQYARYQGLWGHISDIWERYTQGRTPVNLFTGQRGQDALRDLGFFERMIASLGVTPPGMADRVYWASATEMNRPLQELRAMARARRPADVAIRMKTSPSARFQTGKATEEVLNVSMTGSEAAATMARRIITTPMHTFEWAFGLGVKPGTAQEMAWRFFAKGIIPAWLGWEAIKYTDYLSEQTTGFSPIKGLVKMYAGAMTMRQAAMNVTGFSWLSNEMNERTDGLYNSPAGVILRTGGLVAGGLFASKAAPQGSFMKKYGLMLGLGAGAFQLSTTPEKSAKQQWEEYTGKREVPIRRNRWWVMGPTPFGGTDIMYYRKHMVAQVLDDEMYKQYGGKEEYFRNFSLLPTPENLFGARFLTDPYEWERQHYWDRPYPMCFHPETPVLTNEGLKPISDVKVGDMVIQQDGSWTPIKDKTFRQCIEGELVSIRIAGDNRPLRVTENHEILVLKNPSGCHKRGGRCREKQKVIADNKPIWVRAKDIERSDFVVWPIPKFERDKIVLDLAGLGLSQFQHEGRQYVVFDARTSQEQLDARFTDRYKNIARDYPGNPRTIYGAKGKLPVRRFPRFVTLDDDLARFLGWYTAEGSARNAEIKLSLCADEMDIAKWCGEYAKRVFGATFSISPEKGSNGISVYINSKILSVLVKGLIPGHAQTKRIPTEIFHSRTETVHAYLKGLLGGDGHLRKGEYAFVTSSGGLAYDVRLLLLSIGVCSSISYREVGKYKASIRGREIHSGLSFTICIFGQWLDKLLDVASDRPTRAYIIHGDFMYIPVRQVARESYNGLVYDISLNTDPSFLTTCVVHNSRGMFSDVPLAGPALNLTIGRVLKPRQMMHYQELEDYLHTPQYMGEPGMQGIAQQLGMPVYQGVPPVPHFGLAQEIGMGIKGFTEYAGMPGFMMSALKEKFTGSPDFFMSGPMWDTPDYNVSQSRTLYEANLGGMFGMCFVAGTPVTTVSGRKPIEDVQIGEGIISMDGTPRKVVGKLIKESSALYQLEISSIDSKIIGTGTHNIPIFRPGKCKAGGSKTCLMGRREACKGCRKGKPVHLEDMELGAIRPGDFVCVPIIKPSPIAPVIDLAPFSERAHTDKWIYNRASPAFATIHELLEGDPSLTRADLRAIGYNDLIVKEAIRGFRQGDEQRFPRFVQIDVELAYVLGWWVAEGSLDKNGRVNFSMHVKETTTAEEIGRIIRSKFGSNFAIQHGAGNGIQLRSQCVPLYLLCEGLFGTGAKLKTIPYIIKSMPINLMEAFFKGVVLGDGWADGKHAGFTSVSAQLCRDVFDIALTLGIKGHLNLDYIEKGRGYYPQGTPRPDSCRSYIDWPSSSGRKVATILGKAVVSPIAEHTKSFIYNGMFFVKVKSCRPIESKVAPVYDLEIENLHYYTAGGIIVHNTEPLRRLVYKKPYEANFVNPIPNTMPSWLPGSKSGFGDTDFIDFHQGDPYAKIPGGPYRLPVPGVEAGQMNMGSAPSSREKFERWQTLMNVAPFSKGTKYYGNVVDQMAMTGELNSRYMEKYQDVAGRAPAGWMGTSIAGPMGAGSGMASHVPNIPYVSAKLLGHRDAMDAYRAYVLYGSDFQDWKHPYEMMLDPYLSFQSSQSAPEAVYGGAMLGVLGRPGSRAGLTTFGAAYGLVSSVTGPWKSNKEQEREYTEEYFDNLRYVKLRTMEERASSMRRYDLVQQLERMEGSTMAGLDYGGDIYKFYMNAYKALPKKDRNYMLALAADPSTNLEELPEYMRGPVSRLQSINYTGSPAPSQRVRDMDAVNDLLNSGGLPPPNWAGWSPDVRVSDVKMSTVANEGFNLHDYGSAEPEVAKRMGMMPLAPLDIYSPDLFARGRTRYNIKRAMGYSGIDANVNVLTLPGGGDTMDIDAQRDRNSDARNWRNRGRW